MALCDRYNRSPM